MADLQALAEKCGMTIFDLNTDVVLSDDGRGRISIDSFVDPEWSDHMSIRWNTEKDRLWFYAHFSADKAELIGRLLIQRAKDLRKRNASNA